ncbi:MAG: hypothetical protein II331_07455 [Lachnospiraceae bacterium]|nr:hypothetical protein [Lachnospiraceae bacterium]
MFKMWKLRAGCRKYLKEELGALTLEASLIMPIILVVFLSMFYLLFYAIDAGKIHAVIGESGIKASSCFKNGGNLDTGNYSMEQLLSRDLYYLVTTKYEQETQAVKQHVRKKLNQKSLFSEVSKVDVAIEKQRIIIKVESHLKMPLLGVFLRNQLKGLTIRQKGVTQIERSSEFIRRCYLLE